MTVFLAGIGWAGLLALLWLIWEVGLPLAPRSYPAPSSRLSKTRAALTLMKEFEEQQWALMERTSTPVTMYLKQKKIRRLVPGELCSPQERRKGLGFLSSDTQDAGERAVPTASRVEGAPSWSGVCTVAPKEMEPCNAKALPVCLGVSSTAPPFTSSRYHLFGQFCMTLKLWMGLYCPNTEPVCPFLRVFTYQETLWGHRTSSAVKPGLEDSVLFVCLMQL